MVELIGDMCIPSELIVPEHYLQTEANVNISGGKLFISGGKLHFTFGAVTEIITSA